VRQHAVRHASESSWLAAELDLRGRMSGLMSPRIAVPRDRAEWEELADARAGQIDALVAARANLDLMFVGALGAPSYWHVQVRTRVPLPDQGASRWEMKARNAGEDFVHHRLLPIAQSVASRDATSIRDGLEGRITVDLAGRDSLESRTATGLAAPGPADAAAVWCGLWAISQFPVIPLIAEPSRTAGYVNHPQGGTRLRGWLYVPVPRRPMALPRLRSVIVSGAPECVVRWHVGSDRRGPGALDVAAAREWLWRRHVSGTACFPVHASDNPNAPELRALDGVVIPLEEPHVERSF
jgi:CRISPR-associated protein Csb3